MNTKILKALLNRHKKYGEVFLSRCEHKKFGLTEWQMRLELRKLRRNGLNTIGKKYYEAKKYANIYEISDKLMNLILKTLKKVRISFDIVKFNKEVTKEYIKSLFGCKGNGNNLVLQKEKDYKYTFNTEYNIITRWDKGGGENKWMNCFNGLKELFGLNASELISIIR